jgi:ABC-2 type transport system permease protein
MKNIKGMDIRTGMAFVRNEFFNQSIYRTSFWLNMVYTFLMMYSVGYVWRALYASNPTVMKVGLSEMITYAVLGVALEAIMHPRQGPQIYIMEQVRKGTIEMDMIKPIDFQFYMFAKNIGHITVRFLLLVLPSLAAAYFFFAFQFPSMHQFLAFLGSLALAILVSFLLNFILGLLSMITMNIRNINWGYNAVLRFFSGQMVPLWMFPGVLGVMGYLLPFRCIYSIPMSIYIGNYTGFGMLEALGMQFVWVVLLWICSRLLMKYVFRKLLIQGG